MEIKEVLKLKNIKITKGRVMIYDLLLNTEENLSADDIFQVCIKKEDLNLSTVYRTLELFEKNSMVDKIFAEDGTSTYTIKRHKHNHIVECNLCHKEIEVACPMTQIEELLKKQTGFKLTDHKLQLKGLCKECSED
ncbi:Fur family transcriptional regulator [uncultured Clostridium sp.]|uniref:Fur family transcriptional regulator n=1 Tax=uncultured Clostridium sp. TaxID=59620 RepID=UPI00260F2D7D|nr:Fur family transcriptional regulator [uncultured Clostridium sp.]